MICTEAHVRDDLLCNLVVRIIPSPSSGQLLQYLLYRNATSAELCSLNHEPAQRLLSVCADISHSPEINDEFAVSKLICTVLARSLTQHLGPRRNNLTL